jgi:hypothetical protein
VTPAQKPSAALSPKAREAKIGEIVARLTSEARSFQIPLQLILERLHHEKPDRKHS